MDTLLRVENVTKKYAINSRRGSAPHVTALNGVSLELQAGERLAIVGESGSGKSTLALCLACLERISSGVIRFEGEDVSSLPENKLRALRPRVQLVFQDAALSLNPRFSVQDLIAEPMVVRKTMRADQRTARVAHLLDRVGLSTGLLDRRSTELSGGQRQRVAIARALALEPRLLIFDEALSALDCSVQARIANLLLELNETGTLASTRPAMIFITHDMVMAAKLGEAIAVMERGRIVEIGRSMQILRNPRHPATKLLLECTPGSASDAHPSLVA
jgi:peptide/nickel transport system ATP-binding protein